MTTTMTIVPTTRKRRIPSTIRWAAQWDGWDGTPLRSIKRASNGIGLGLGLGFGLGMGNGTGEDTDMKLDSAPLSARPPRPRIHQRAASRSPSSAQNMASSNANAWGRRMSLQRLLGHGRALSTDGTAASGAPQRTKPQSSMTTSTTLYLRLQLWDSGIRSSCVTKRTRYALKPYRLLRS
jgi:hypothetical protein